MIFFRKLHKWLGLIIGVQLIIWLLSGTIISFIDQQEVSGAVTRQAPAVSASLITQAPLFPVAQLPRTSRSLQSITLINFMQAPVYYVLADDVRRIFDAHTGEEISIEKQLAEQIALDSYRGKGSLLDSERLPAGSNEVRDFPGPVWQVNFDDHLNTRVYLAADIGQVLAHRNSRWAVVDFLLMLHFMDYFRDDHFNNPQIIVVGFATLWIAISGMLLVFYSFSRADFLWMPGFRNGGKRVSGTVKSTGRPELKLELDSSLSYYASLSQHEIRLPSNCDGSGSCGLCRVRYPDSVPEPTAVDRDLIDSAALSEGVRLACQHKPRSDDIIVVPEIAFQQNPQWAEVVSSRWLTPMLKEIHLRPDDHLEFSSGDYLQFQVPACSVTLNQLAVPDSFSPIWDALALPESWTYGDVEDQTRTYSIAVAPSDEQPQELVFTVRFFPPPAGTQSLPGMGSSYLCSLQSGDRVAFRGPAGEFKLIESEREKILIGGGAGIAPLKSMALHLLKNQGWSGKLRFWYGARNEQEILYREKFEALMAQHANFEWKVALSEVDDDSQWQGDRGFIHQAVFEQVLRDHKSIHDCEFYLCGPPAMLAATRQMLRELGVAEDLIRFDDFGN